MNKLTLWLAKTQLPKIIRHLVAYAGGVLAANGARVDANDPGQVIAGVLLVLASWLWSVIEKTEGADLLDRALNFLCGIFGDAPGGTKQMLTQWVTVASGKLVAVLSGALTAQGMQADGQLTTEAVLTFLANLALSALSRPDKVSVK